MWRMLNGTGTILYRRVLAGGSGLGLLRRPFTDLCLRRPFTGLGLRCPSLTGEVGLGRAASRRSLSLQPLNQIRGFY